MVPTSDFVGPVGFYLLVSDHYGTTTRATVCVKPVSCGLFDLGAIGEISG